MIGLLFSVAKLLHHLHLTGVSDGIYLLNIQYSIQLVQNYCQLLRISEKLAYGEVKGATHLSEGINEKAYRAGVSKNLKNISRKGLTNPGSLDTLVNALMSEAKRNAERNQPPNLEKRIVWKPNTSTLVSKQYNIKKPETH